MRIFGWQVRSPKIWEGRPLLPIEDTSIDLTPIVLMFLFLGVAALAFFRLKNRQVARKVVQVFSALAFAFGLHPCFCMLRNVLRGVGFISRDNLNAVALLLLFSVVVGFSLLFGRLFCGWVCPLGFFQEVSSWLGRKLFRKLSPAKARAIKYGFLAMLLAGVVVGFVFLRPATYVFTQSIMVFSVAALLLILMYVIADPKAHRRLVYFRYVSLAAVASLFIIGTYFNAPGCVFYCSIDDFGSVISVFALVVAALVVSRAWCRYVCPEGAVLSLCSKGARTQIERDAARCRRCGLCAKVCDMEAISPDGQARHVASCQRCGRCIEKCPASALQVVQKPIPSFEEEEEGKKILAVSQEGERA